MSKELKHQEAVIHGITEGTPQQCSNTIITLKGEKIYAVFGKDKKTTAHRAKLAASAPQLLDALIKTKESIIELSECEDFFPQWVKVLLHTRLCEIETAINKATS